VIIPGVPPGFSGMRCRSIQSGDPLESIWMMLPPSLYMFLRLVRSFED